MRGFIHFLLIVQMALLVVLPSVPSRLQAKTSAIELPTEAASTSNLTTGLPFIENVGQFPDAVRFQAGNLWLAEDSLWLTVMEPQPATEVSNTQASLTPSDTASITSPQQGVNLKLSFVGANPQPQIEAFGRQETYINYFRGNDSAQWRSHVPTWAGVRYKEIYSGVDLEVSSIGGQWRWRLVSSGDVQVASQSLSAVQLRVEGGNDMTLLDDTVHVSTTIGVVNLPLIVVDEAMVVAQAQHASMISLDTVNQPFTTVPTVPVYTAAEDSLLRWATYLGGSTYARVNALALTTNDEVVVAGFTFSSDFPVTPGAFDTSIGGGDDGIVARLSADGSTLRWATYLGGSTYARVNALALTTNDEVVVAGITGSSDFPVTSGAFDTSFGDGDFHEAAFVARLIADGSTLRWATYLGGSSSDRVDALALTTNDEVVVAGFAGSSDFPVTSGAFDTSLGDGEGIVARLSADGSTLRWATYLGGSSGDRVDVLALTTNDEVVVAGATFSSDFPVTSGAFDTSFGDGDFHEAAFVARLIADGSTLRWATFLGGSSSDRVYALALTTNNEVVVAGFTRSSDFPVTPGAFDTSIGGGDDGDFHEAAFAARLRMESRVEPTPDPPPNGYSISGRLVGEEGNPIAAAVVNYGSKFVTSNLSGNYTITGLITGTYTLTPTSVLNHFEPLARTITVPPNATDQNFIGISIRPLPVVLVHGWNDTAASWETYLDDFLPSIGRKGWAVDSMYTGWGVGIPLSIDENAKKLANYIAYVKSETGAKQVDIVVHSMGGLISRRYIAAYMDKNAPDVNQLIMLGTPNGGTKTAVVNQLAFYLGTKFNPSSTEITPWSVEQFNADNFDRRGVPFYAVAGNYRCDTKFPKSNLIEGPDPDDVAVWRLSVFAIALEGRWTYPSAQVSGCGGDHRGMRSSAENDGGQQIFNLFVSPLLRGQMPATPSESVAFLSNQTDISQAALAQAENNALQFSGVQSGTLEAGGRSEFSQLLESTASAGFTVVAPPDQVVVSLRDPNGQVIASSTTDANVQFMQMDPEFMSITSYVITNPTPGIWTTIVEANTKTPDEGVVIASIGSLSSDLQLILPVAENAAGINRPVQIAARLQSGATPVLGASVNAQLVSPDGLVTLIALADDGLHGDGSMGDGLYGYQFIPMTPGVYSALISAEGVNGDTHFERSTVWAIQVDGNQVFLPLTLR